MTDEMRIVSGLTACFFVAAIAAASAERDPQPPQGRHRHQAAAPAYDPATETTLRCTVDAVEEVDPRTCRNCEGGIHLSATCAEEEIDVHLGPAAFLKEKNFEVEAGDEIEVTGSRITYEGEASLIAKEIRKGDTVLELRDDQGRPLWRRSAR